MKNKTTISARPFANALKGLTLAAAVLVGSPASAFVLDFEGFGLGQIIDDEYEFSPSPGVRISATNLGGGPDRAVIFDTENPTGGDWDLEAPFIRLNDEFDQPFRPGNVLIIQENYTCDLEAGFCREPDDEGSRPAGEFEFIFNDVITLQTLDFFDVELEENNNNPNSEIRLYDVNDVEIFANTFFVPNTGGDNKWNQLDFGNAAGVKRIVIEMNGSGAIDNLTYVPIPAAAWLMLSGLGVLGAMARRRS